MSPGTPGKRRPSGLVFLTQYCLLHAVGLPLGAILFFGTRKGAVAFSVVLGVLHLLACFGLWAIRPWARGFAVGLYAVTIPFDAVLIFHGIAAALLLFAGIAESQGLRRDDVSQTYLWLFFVFIAGVLLSLLVLDVVAVCVLSGRRFRESFASLAHRIEAVEAGSHGAPVKVRAVLPVGLTLMLLYTAIRAIKWILESQALLPAVGQVLGSSFAWGIVLLVVCCSLLTLGKWWRWLAVEVYAVVLVFDAVGNGAGTWRTSREVALVLDVAVLGYLLCPGFGRRYAALRERRLERKRRKRQRKKGANLKSKGGKGHATETGQKPELRTDREEDR